MGTIKSGLSQFVYNGDAVTLSSVSWLNSIRAVYKVNATNSGWISFSPTRSLNAFSSLEPNVFYLVSALEDFTLPDAQVWSCVTGEDALIPQGLSQFVYAATDLVLGSSFFNATGIYRVNSTRTGWLSWKPGRTLQGFTTLLAGTFYFITASAAFSLPGAQNVSCADTYGSEKVDGSKYVRYIDLKGDTADPTEKTAPNMVLFAALKAAFDTHNHDTRYYTQNLLYTKAEIDLFFQGVDEVIEYPNFAGFPPVGEASKLYIAADTNTGFRWNGTGYSPVSSPGVDLTPYLTKTEAANVYQVKGDYLTIAAANNLYPLKTDVWTKPEADARYQFKGNFAPAGNYVKSGSINFGTPQLPDPSGNINLTHNVDIDAYLKARPGYNALIQQTLIHDTNGIIRWGDSTIPPVEPIVEKFDYTLNFKVA